MAVYRWWSMEDLTQPVDVIVQSYEWWQYGEVVDYRVDTRPHGEFVRGGGKLQTESNKCYELVYSNSNDMMSFVTFFMQILNNRFSLSHISTIRTVKTCFQVFRSLVAVNPRWPPLVTRNLIIAISKQHRNVNSGSCYMFWGMKNPMKPSQWMNTRWYTLV